MKDFRNLLTERNNDGFIRHLNRLPVGGYELSIQASKHAYCIPRGTLENLFDYTAMEVAIFKDDKWTGVERDSFFDEWKDKECFLEDYDGMVAGYVPVEVIQSLYEYIEAKNNNMENKKWEFI